jgi:SAM-dependent methyltransferase
MNGADAQHYLCTICGSGLSLIQGAQVDSNGTVVEGKLGCPSCGKEHPITQGIPRFVPSESYVSSFGYQWNKHRKTQLDSHIGRPLSSQRLFEVSGWPRNLEGDLILEAGSGAGRFTEVLLATGAELFSFDYSKAVDANFQNNGDHPNLHLFQGDIFNIPLPKASFDKVICLGVLQHTPAPEEAFRGLTKYVKPGGELVIDVYKATFPSYLQWKYALRPITRRMDKERLYGLVSALTPPLIPLAAALRKVAGRFGARLVPIVEYSHLGLSPETNRDWAILDTFDMYSPTHDHPQTISSVGRWFSAQGFTNVIVRYGPNGIVGKGQK